MSQEQEEKTHSILGDTQNREGLTFPEWFRAANFARRVPMGVEPARRAWKRGDDPTEYAAI